MVCRYDLTLFPVMNTPQKYSLLGLNISRMREYLDNLCHWIRHQHRRNENCTLSGQIVLKGVSMK